MSSISDNSTASTLPQWSLFHPSPNLCLRCISSVALALIAGSALWLGGWYFVGLVALVSLGLSWEYCHLARLRSFKPRPYLVGVCSLAMVLIHSFNFETSTQGWLSMVVLLWCFFCSALDNVFHPQERSSAMADSALNCMAVLYCGFLPALMISLRHIHLFLVAFVVLICIVTDVGAYAIGRTLGCSKLCPCVSPGKTWAGFWGALGCSFLAAWGGYVGSQALQLDLQFNLFFWLVLGLGCSLMGQLGDLYESSLKRDAQAKDSGDAIPGHGGLLDRFDSYLFATMFAYFMVVFTVSLAPLTRFFTS